MRARLLPGAVLRCRIDALDSETVRGRELALDDLLPPGEIRAAIDQAQPVPGRAGDSAGNRNGVRPDAGLRGARSTAPDAGEVLAALCREAFGDLPFRAVVHRGAGMVAVDPSTALGSLIGPGGSTVDRVRRLAGLRSLRLVRMPGMRPRQAGARPEAARLVPEATRLRSALRAFGAAGFDLRPPARAGASWTVTLSRRDLPRMLNGGGAGLFLVARLAGVKVRFDTAGPGGAR